MILVIGGRSKIGAAVIDGLADRGRSVRALVRSEEAGESLPDGVEAITGDLGDPGSLRKAMDDVERVVLLSGPHPDQVQWHRNAIDAACETGVELLVRSSILQAGPSARPAARRAAGSRRLLKQEIAMSFWNPPRTPSTSRSGRQSPTSRGSGRDRGLGGRVSRHRNRHLTRPSYKEIG